MSEAPKDDKPDVKKMVAENMSVALCELFIKLAKGTKKPYAEMNEFEKRSFISDADHAIKTQITRAVDIIVAQKRTVVKCQVDQVVFKDGVKIVLKAGMTDATHAIADAQGQHVLVVITGVEKFIDGPAPKPEKDQKPLFDKSPTAAAGGSDKKKDGRTSRSNKKK